MRISSFAISVFLLLVVATVAVAEYDGSYDNKDTSYWPNRRSNPNEKKFDMYWREGKNVLLDINKFDKLYVKFHNCVWSEYGLEDAEDGSQGCGNPADENGDDDEGSYWYMGASQCFRANAAFTLYGVLEGKSGSGCSKATYINSFFTRLGVSEYMNAITDYSGYEWQTQYEVDNRRRRLKNKRRELDQEEDDYQYGYANEEVDGQEDQEEDKAEEEEEEEDDAIVVSSYCYNDGEDNDDDRENFSMGERSFPYATSYTVGCLNNNYVYASFNGAYCAGSWAKQVEDELSDFNKEINQLGCTEIYSSNGNGDGDGDEGGEMNEAVYDLLYNSAACSLRQNPHRCPDPHGLLKRYTRAIERSTRSISNSTAGKKLDKTILWLTWLLGIGFMIASFYITGKAAKDVEKQQAYAIMAKAAAAAAAGDIIGDYDDEKKDDISKNPATRVREASSLVRQSSSLIAKGVAETASNISEMATNVKEKVQDYAEATAVVETVDVDAGEVAEDAEDCAYVDASDAVNAEDNKDGVASFTSQRSLISKLMDFSAVTEGTNAATNEKSGTDYVPAPEGSSSSTSSKNDSTSKGDDDVIVVDDDDEPVLVPMVPEANAAEIPEAKNASDPSGVDPINRGQNSEADTSKSHGGRGDNSGRSFRSLWSNKSGRSTTKSVKSEKSNRSNKSSGIKRYIRPRLAKISKLVFGKKNGQKRYKPADLLAPDSMEFGENDMTSF